MQAGHLHAQYLAVRSSDSYNRGGSLREQCGRVLAALRTFRASFHQVLPPSAVMVIDDIVERTGALINDTGVHGCSRTDVGGAGAPGTAFETEMSFLPPMSKSPYAHDLNAHSLICNGPSSQMKMSAQSGREPLMMAKSHVRNSAPYIFCFMGVWAFKVDAAGARTDLVFQEPVADLTAPQRYADGLVLTEWKKAAEDAQSSQRFEARSQASRYAQGALAATELTGYRYVVIVSRSQVEVPDDMGRVVWFTDM